MALGSMGIDCADYDNDGWLDLFQTAYASELPVLYRNTGEGFFEDVTRTPGLESRTYPHVNWGTGFATSTTTATATCSSPTAICKTTSSCTAARPPSKSAIRC
jgi:hypothetical protein